MQKNHLSPAMYHGANSFAKEIYRETTYAGFGCIGNVPDIRGASKFGRQPRTLLHSPGLLYARGELLVAWNGIAAPFSVEKEQ
jgi:hypothetical protein